MNIIETEDHAAMSARAAETVITAVNAKPDLVLALPTGETPRDLFALLVAAQASGAVDFRRVEFITLDEYADIAADDPRGLIPWLWSVLLAPLGVDRARVHALDPDTTKADATITAMEGTIERLGGIDLCVLGLGMNGHAAFNEPGSPFDGRTHVLDLTPDSFASGAATWGSAEKVPRRAITLGLGTLSKARKLVLIASGQKKAGILGKVLTGPVGSAVPATIVRNHPDATVIADRAALGR